MTQSINLECVFLAFLVDNQQFAYALRNYHFWNKVV